MHFLLFTFFARESSKYHNHTFKKRGTNDLGGRDAEKTFQNLKQIHEFARSNNKQSIIVTLPELGFEKREKWLTEVRVVVNDKLRNYGQENAIPVVELDKLMPQLTLDPKERKKLWSDDIHMMPEGYDLLGEFVWEKLKPILK